MADLTLNILTVFHQAMETFTFLDILCDGFMIMALQAKMALLSFTAIVLLLGYVSPGYATIFESILSPDQVIEGHKEFELECDNCHESFEKGLWQSMYCPGVSR